MPCPPSDSVREGSAKTVRIWPSLLIHPESHPLPSLQRPNDRRASDAICSATRGSFPSFAWCYGFVSLLLPVARSLLLLLLMHVSVVVW